MTPQEIKRRRQSIGVSRRTLAEEVGVHPRTVAGWERGEKAPGRASIKSIGAVLTRLERAASEPARLTARDIRFGRESLGMSQEELARAIGADLRSVVAWERHRRSPQATFRRRMIALFAGEIGVADEARLAVNAPLGTPVQGPDGSWGYLAGMTAEGLLISWGDEEDEG